MLAGPTTQQTPSLGLGAFDSSFVRTGLTPDVSRTGLTPLIGGPGGFPPPSPNTAALFALVNGTSASGSNIAITPGTLNAITGALNQSLNAIHQPTSMSLEQPQSMVDHQQQNNNANYPNSDAFSSHDSASHAISNAASALYLLSQQQSLQRHQNQAQQNALAAQGQGQVNPSAVSGPPQQALPESPTTSVAPTRRATKRKTMDAPAPVPRGKKARSASTSGAAGVSTRGAANKRKSSKMEEDDMMDDDFDEDDEDDDMYMEGLMGPPSTANAGRASGGGGSGRSKKPETEEEKRRNFLERNRQAALKCRQRKKAWLQALQAKVEFLTSENERLSNALVTSREEVARLSQAVVAQGGAPSALLNIDPNASGPNGPNGNSSAIMNSVNTGNESTASPVDHHARRNSGSSTTTTGQGSVQNSQPLLPQTMSSGLNHGIQAHHGHSHSMGGHSGVVGNVNGMGHSRSHSHGHGHPGVPAQNGVTVGGRGYGY